ncbi:MAG: DNA primase [Pseudomonadota bacterium]
MIPQSFIQDLLNRVDIVDVIERYVPLKRAGANYKACCPFHTEKSPSFTVSQTKQFYHCFGCGAHGSAIGFLMEYRGLGYVDAIKDLAAALGLEVPDERRPDERPRDATAELLSALDRAARFYRDQLKQAPGAIDYLKRRGVSGEIAARFGIGYAPDAWQALEACFPDYTSAVLERAGLVLESDSGRRYDRFRDRIMFPIASQAGHIVGFGGRVIGEGEPKYLNSPETPVFEKGRELYGLFQARPAIRAAGRALVVEGYMDVVALAQHGIGYAVATLGTATTGAQLQKLLRQTDSVVFCFDGDEPGRRAAWRALENVLPFLADGKEVSFLFLPAGEDPDSLVRRGGAAAMEAELARVVPLTVFLVRELSGRVDLSTDEGCARLLKLAQPLITQVRAPTLGLMLRKRIAEAGRVTLQELNAIYREGSSRSTPEVPVRRAPPGPVGMYRHLLRCVLARPGLATRVRPDLLDPADADSRALAELLDLLSESPHLREERLVPAVFERFRGTASAAAFERAAGDIGQWDETWNVDGEFAGALAQLERRRKNQRIEELHRKSAEGLTPAEIQEYRQLIAAGSGEHPRVV